LAEYQVLCFLFSVDWTRRVWL